MGTRRTWHEGNHGPADSPAHGVRHATAAEKDKAMKPKVYLHVRQGGQWQQSAREFLRLPTVGEFLTTDATEPWYRVTLVVHCPFDADYAAEVFAVPADQIEATKAAERG
jgi:hypothetical protein